MTVAEVDAPAASSGPQLEPRSKPQRGMTPVFAVLAAFAVGAVLAKVLDRRSGRA